MIKAGHYSVQTVESIEEVQIVGGIDISTSKFNSNFAVVAFSLFNYPSLDLINRVSKENSDGFAPFDVVLPVCMNVARLGGSKVIRRLVIFLDCSITKYFYYISFIQVPVYISSGFGIDLNLATEIVLNTATNRICKPIRQIIDVF
uniref:Uncharacterized protein n=1 Tax=Heterorhabditis bacteriophora TaxID=37862 RepID=A0A1I7WK94_HETBA